MANIQDFPDVPGYLSIKQAAQFLGITDKRVYRYIDEQRLKAFQSGGVFLLAEQDVENFKLSPPGRTRKRPTAWHLPHPRSEVLATEIVVQVRAGQQALLVEKLYAIQRADRHTFPGTIARHVVKGSQEMMEIRFFLVWKGLSIAEVTEHESFRAFQEDLAEVLDWETAQYRTNEIIIHT